MGDGSHRQDGSFAAVSRLADVRKAKKTPDRTSMKWDSGSMAAACSALKMSDG